MPHTEEQEPLNSAAPAPPPPSYTSIGLSRKFMQAVKDRQKVALRLSKLTTKKEEYTLAIKRAFIAASFGVDPDPTSEEFKDLLKAVPGSGSDMCSAAGWRVGILPGSRKSIDETKLRLKLSDYDLTMEQTDAIVRAATNESTWGEIVVEPLVGKQVKVKKGAAKKKKVAKKPAPVASAVPTSTPVSTPAAKKGAAKKAATVAPSVPSAPKRRGMIKPRT